MGFSLSVIWYFSGRCLSGHLFCFGVVAIIYLCKGF